MSRQQAVLGRVLALREGFPVRSLDDLETSRHLYVGSGVVLLAPIFLIHSQMLLGGRLRWTQLVG